MGWGVRVEVSLLTSAATNKGPIRGSSRGNEALNLFGLRDALGVRIKVSLLTSAATVQHEWLTRGTVWLALFLYVWAELELAKRRDALARSRVRWLHRLAWLSFVAHVVCAFHFYHQWSHAQAMADTARQTAAMVGWNWGGGLWFNYLFAVLWTSELAWAELDGQGYRTRAGWVNWSVRAFFFFMLFNGAVLFAQSPQRWLGLLLCGALAWAWRPRTA